MIGISWEVLVNILIVRRRQPELPRLSLPNQGEDNKSSRETDQEHIGFTYENYFYIHAIVSLEIEHSSGVTPHYNNKLLIALPSTCGQTASSRLIQFH